MPFRMQRRRKSRSVMASFFTALVREMYIVTAPDLPFFCSFPMRDSRRFEPMLAVEALMLFFFAVPAVRFPFGFTMVSLFCDYLTYSKTREIKKKTAASTICTARTQQR